MSSVGELPGTLMTRLIGELPLDDAMQLRVVCRKLHLNARPYDIAVAFGMTRTRIGGSSMTLGRWQEIWGECASAVKSRSIEASSWGYAIEFVRETAVWCLDWNTDTDIDNELATECELDPMYAAPLIDEMIVLAPELLGTAAANMPRVAVILLLAGSHMRWQFTDIQALVILSDGRFAAVSGSSESDAFESPSLFSRHAAAAVRFGTSLAELAALLEQDFGGRLKLKEHVSDIASDGFQYKTREPDPCFRYRRPPPLQRYAADGFPYEHIEFIRWYKTYEYANDRWLMARTCNARGDRFAAMVANPLELT